MEKESKQLEYKKEVTKTFLKTVSAYANYSGGQIIFGVTDDLKIVGIDNPIKACEEIENKINDCVNPNPEYDIEIEKKTKTIILSVHSGINKPYFYNNKVYKRNNSSTIEVDNIELRRLIMDGSNISFDSLKSEEQNLNFNTLEEYLKKEIKIDNFNKDILKTLQLYKENDGYNNAANLLSDNNSFLGIDCIRFGNSENVIMDREDLNNMSIIEQFNKCINTFNKYYKIEVINGVKRENKQLIPEIAFRESLANAIIHKTYDINSSIKVKMFDDYLEIISPGTLPIGISEDDYKEGKLSVLRNPIIAGVFYRLKYIERLGTGIKRINEIYRKTEVKPEYTIAENYISIKLPCVNKVIDLDETEQIVKKILDNGKLLSRLEIDKYAKLGKDKTIRILNSLSKKKIIEKIGNGKSVKYKIAK